jgi:hypothetical protein
VVYVVLEPQYQSSLSSAIRAINASNSQVAFEVNGYLIEELRDAKTTTRPFKQDVAAADVFIASLIFIEDLAQKVVEAVAPHRDQAQGGRGVPLHAGGDAAQQTGHASRWPSWARARAPSPAS